MFLSAMEFSLYMNVIINVSLKCGIKGVKY